MDFAYRVHSSFDASHRVEGVKRCERLHGHTFDVTASIEGPLMAEADGVKRVRLSETLQEELDAITAELDHRDLNEMMVGSIPIPEVIAGWILERLPNADWVLVKMGWRRTVGWAKRNKR